MAQLKTVKIANEAGGYLIINEADFDAESMELFDPTPKTKAEVKAEAKEAKAADAKAEAEAEAEAKKAAKKGK